MSKKPCDNNDNPINNNEAIINNSAKNIEIPGGVNSPNPNPKEEEKAKKQNNVSIFSLNKKIEPETIVLETSSAGSKTENLQKTSSNTTTGVSGETTSSTGSGSTGSGSVGGATGGAGSGSGGGSSSGGGSGTKNKLKATSPQLGKSHGKDTPKKNPCNKEFDKMSIYPFNKVTQSESGHILEMDDNPGGERLHICHRTGTNVEFNPAGSLNAVITRDMWWSVYRDAHIHVDGYTDITIDKSLRICVNQDEMDNTKDKAVNFDVYVGGKSNVNLYVRGGNVNITVEDGDVNLEMKKGDVNIRQNEGNYNHFVNGDYNLEVTGNCHTVVGGNVLTEIGGSRETIIQGKFGDTVHLIGGDFEILSNGSVFISAKEKREYIEENSFLVINGIQSIYSKGRIDEIDGDAYRSCSGHYDSWFYEIRSQRHYGKFPLIYAEYVEADSENVKSLKWDKSPLNVFTTKNPKKEFKATSSWKKTKSKKRTN